MELFHALNRGVDKRSIFLDNSDRARFVHDMYEFNKTKKVRNIARNVGDMSNLRGRTSSEPLVDIHGWCLMRNHYHLLISEHAELGISRFLMKLNVGYAKYFNEKYKRSGTLFQSRTKKIEIRSDPHFLYILHYIHLNPLDFSNNHTQWREGKVKNATEALRHLEQYRWSSYSDYCGKKNFPSVLTTELFKDVFGDYKKKIAAYLRDLDVDDIKELTLE